MSVQYWEETTESEHTHDSVCMKRSFKMTAGERIKQQQNLKLQLGRRTSKLLIIKDMSNTNTKV